MFEKRKLYNPPCLQEMMKEIDFSGACAEIFPETFKPINILLALPVVMSSEHSFSEMKLIKKIVLNLDLVILILAD